MILNILHKRY